MINFILVNIFWLALLLVAYNKNKCSSCKISLVYARMRSLKNKIETTVNYPENINKYTFMALNRLNVGLLIHSLFYSPNLIEYIDMGRISKKNIQLYRLGERSGGEIKSCIVTLCNLQALVLYNISICTLDAASIPEEMIDFPMTEVDIFSRTKFLYEICSEHRLLASDIIPGDAYAYLCKIGIIIGIIEYMPGIHTVDHTIVY